MNLPRGDDCDVEARPRQRLDDGLVRPFDRDAPHVMLDGVGDDPVDARRVVREVATW